MPRPIRISIPQRGVAVLKWFANLPEQDFELILSALQDGDAVQSRSDVVTQLQEALPDAPAQRAEELVSEVFSLLLLNFSHNWEIEEIAEKAAASLSLALNPDQQLVLKTRLSAISSNPILILLAKAYDVAAEHQNLLHESRIISDIRPVHKSGPGSPVVGAIITHILKLEYHSLRGREELYVALNDQDLEELGEAVARAKDESQSLEAFIKSANVQDLSASTE
jgi:hypothetical protein